MATHINPAVTVKGTAEQLVWLAPRSDLRINDTWDILGLRATASLDHIADVLLVADRFVYGVDRANTVDWPATSGHCSSPNSSLTASSLR